MESSGDISSRHTYMRNASMCNCSITVEADRGCRGSKRDTVVIAQFACSGIVCVLWVVVCYGCVMQVEHSRDISNFPVWNIY
jgi:hypothetical protein